MAKRKRQWRCPFCTAILDDLDIAHGICRLCTRDFPDVLNEGKEGWDEWVKRTKDRRASQPYRSRRKAE